MFIFTNKVDEANLVSFVNRTPIVGPNWLYDRFIFIG